MLCTRSFREVPGRFCVKDSVLPGGSGDVLCKGFGPSGKSRGCSMLGTRSFWGVPGMFYVRDSVLPGGPGDCVKDSVFPGSSGDVLC